MRLAPSEPSRLHLRLDAVDLAVELQRLFRVRRGREGLKELPSDMAMAARCDAPSLGRRSIVSGEPVGEQRASTRAEHALGDGARAAPIEHERDRAVADEHPDPGLLIVAQETK